MQISFLRSTTAENRKKYHLVVSALYAAQAIAFWLLSHRAPGVRPITISYQTLDSIATAMQKKPILTGGIANVGQLNIAHVVVAALLAAALANLLAGSVLRRRYEQELRSKASLMRRAEGALAGGLLVVALALLVGVYDISSLLMIFSLAAVVSVVWLGAEKMREHVVRSQGGKPGGTAAIKLLYATGVVAGAIPWLVIAAYLLGAHAYGNGIPKFVYYLLASLFVTSLAFAAAMYFQLRRRGVWKDYIYGAFIQSVICFIALTLLTWQLYLGALRN